jgi:hypothetical protein
VGGVGTVAEGVRKKHSRFSEAIEMRRGWAGIAVTAQAIGAQGIGGDENDVRLFHDSKVSEIFQTFFQGFVVFVASRGSIVGREHFFQNKIHVIRHRLKLGGLGDELLDLIVVLFEDFYFDDIWIFHEEIPFCFIVRRASCHSGGIFLGSSQSI